MLYRTELIDFMAVRHDDDAARMLSRSLFDPCTAVSQTIHLSLVDTDLPLFKIPRHITISDPVLDRTDGSCFIYIFLAENLFDILLRRTLILPGKIQVDIRLLVGFESQERLKRDRKPFLAIRSAAFRADLVRHIHAAVVELFVAPFQVLAVRTQVVRRQWIYFGDSRHGCCKGGSYGSSRSYQVSIRKGFLYQKLRRPVHYGVPVVDDGVELLVKPLPYLLRQRRSVHVGSTFLAGLSQIFFCPFDLRREFTIRHRHHGFDFVCDLIGIGDNDFIGLFLSQIHEFFHHFIGRPEVETFISLNIFKSLSRHNDPTVQCLFCIKIMSIAGRHHRLAVLLSQRDDLSIDFPQRLLILDMPAFDEKSVVDQRLDLQIIIEFHKAFQLLFPFLVKDSLIHLSRFTGRSDDKPLSIFCQHGFRHPRFFIKIVEM